MTMHVTTALLFLAAVAASACGAVVGDEEEVMAVWDLRETRSVEAVGWPEDVGSAFEARSEEGLERILLSGGAVIEGNFRANVSRDGGLLGQPRDDELRSLTVTFEREPVDEALERAGGFAHQLDIELGGLPSWAARNRGGQDLGPGGAMDRSDERVLPDGGVAHLSARAFANGGAVMRVEVYWPRDDGAE